MTEVSLEARVAALEEKVEFLSKSRPGRRFKPNVVTQEGVCGINPECDSTACTDATIYRYQQGCRGAACVKINREYYSQYRAARRQEAKPVSEAVVENPPLLRTISD